MKGRAKTLALLAMFMLTTPAFADDCATAIADLDQKISAANVAPEILKEVQIMRLQAEQMCQEGQDAQATEMAQIAGELLGDQ